MIVFGEIDVILLREINVIFLEKDSVHYQISSFVNEMNKNRISHIS